MSPRRRTDARERIVSAATALFYERGYRATSMDEVIEKSGVSKPTVYAYFPTKESLCVAYLQEMRRREYNLLKGALRKEKSPRGRFVAIIKHVRERILSNDFRGCGFFNMISEIADAKSDITREAKVYVDTMKEVIREVVLELRASDGRHKRLDVERLTDTYYLIVAGAIMASQEYRASWPADRAVEHVESLLEG